MRGAHGYLRRPRRIHERWVLGKRTGKSWSAQLHPGGFQRMAEGVIGGRTFEAAMRQAVRALGIAADAVMLPIGIVDEILERRHVAFVHQQVAGLLPAENVAAGHAPGAALVTLVAAHEI